MPTVDLSDVASRLGGSQRLTGFLATPSGAGPWPGVVVVPEIWGLSDVTRRHAGRLASLGYLSLAIDQFSDGGMRRCLVPTMRALVSGRGRPLTDIDAAREWLALSPECTGKVGIIGFCSGGGFALLTAGDGFEAASINYGQLPRHLDAALADACPIVASYGGRDHSLRRAAAKLEGALSRAGVEHDVKEYPSAGHSFLNDEETGPRLLRPLERVVMGAGPEPAAAADAWRRIEAFFATHLR
jgi:carboxymethylenebutenolidase